MNEIEGVIDSSGILLTKDAIEAGISSLFYCFKSRSYNDTKLQNARLPDFDYQLL